MEAKFPEKRLNAVPFGTDLGQSIWKKVERGGVVFMIRSIHDSGLSSASRS